MTPKLALRDYQTQGITDLITRWDAGGTRVPMVLATGLGKTIMFADLAGRWINGPEDSKSGIAYRPSLHEVYGMGKRVLIIAHTDELIDQAARKARGANPELRVGIVKATQNETHADIVVSSRQTLASPARRNQLRNVGLIVIDEAHHALRTNTYGTILEHFGAWEHECPGCDVCTRDQAMGRTPYPHPPKCKVAGFTATLARGDKGKLSTVWEEVSFKRDILFGIRRGFLLDVRGKRIVVPDLDMSRVRQTAGDFRDGDVAEELERTFAPEIIARDYKTHAAGRKGIAFWPLVETAEHGARAFNAAGISSEVIHGKLGKTERRAMLARLHSGETQVIHGVAVLTEGFDEPTVDVVVIARPTRSAPLYQQMVGRVLRPDLTLAPEQREKALILDVVGAGAKHDLRSLIDLAPERDLRQDEDHDDFSLLELDEWELEELADKRAGATFTFDSEEYAGATEVREFDPLGRDQLWAQTPAGTWYMGAGGDAYAFLVDSLTGDPGTYDVVLCSKPKWDVEQWARGTQHVGLPLDMALGWAEEEAMELGGHGTKTLTGRKSAWRKDEPTPKQEGKARRLGIDITGMSKGELSVAIDSVEAARRIDPLVEAVKGAGE